MIFNEKLPLWFVAIFDIISVSPNLLVFLPFWIDSYLSAMLIGSHSFWRFLRNVKDTAKENQEIFLLQPSKTATQWCRKQGT